MTDETDRCRCGHSRDEHRPSCSQNRISIGSTPPGFRPRTEPCRCLGFDFWKTSAEAEALRTAGRVEAGALVATFLVCVIGISLFALAVMGARSGLCKVDATHSYCHTAVAK